MIYDAMMWLALPSLTNDADVIQIFFKTGGSSIKRSNRLSFSDCASDLNCVLQYPWLGMIFAYM